MQSNFIKSAILWDVELSSLIDVSEESAASIFRVQNSVKQAELNSQTHSCT
jgi:hypothetical protein